jgi:peptidylamidoglycolate lyase
LNRKSAQRVTVVGAFMTLLVVTSPAVAQSVAADGGYHVVHGWPELPAGEMLGQATGVDIDSKGNIWVFHRAGREWSEPFPKDPIPRSTVWVFDAATGRLITSWGAGRFIMPHGITIDRDDNVWLTDVGLQQVFKFTPDGRLLLTLGEAGVPGNDARHFDKPTDVAVAEDGTFFVSDGYGNARVLKFSAEGVLLKSWGTPGTGPGEFDLPHGIAIDRAGRVLVADRANARVQVFDQSGRFLTQWHSAQLGRPYAVDPAPSGRLFVADGGDQPEAPPDRSGVAVTDADGRVLARFGRFGNYDGQFRLAHDIAVAKDGAVYVVDAWGQRVQKFVAQ